ncbi:MAG TPA: ABC transporter permease [Gemmatimonadaceae bacterium]|nr:ABC transporter permease [Gemmatimonadaceae bacterium]
MPRPGTFGRQLRSLLWKASVSDEVDAELAFHVEMRTREYIARGLDPELARAKAVGRFGNLKRVNDTCRRIGEGRERDMRRAEWIHEFVQDARYALRQLARMPGFTAVSALTLAIGIGATTAIFSIVNAVVLRPLPFPDPDRLVRVYSNRRGTDGSTSAANFVRWRERSHSFSQLVPVEYRNFTLLTGDRPAEQVTGLRVSADFFPALGLGMRLGRPFSAEEDQPGRDNVVILNERFWKSRFNGDSSVIGRSVRLNAVEHVVIGVISPAADVMTADANVWVPIAFTSEERGDSRKGYLDVFGRLAPGVSLAQAQSEMSAIAKGLETELEENRENGVRLASLTEVYVGSYRSRLFILLGAVAFVLLIACVNVANLLLARGAARGKEISIRAALGAGRARVLRQLFTESVVLAGIGGAIGLLLAFWGVRALKAVAPSEVPRLDQAGLDPLTVAFALGATVVSSIVFGLAPALRTARSDLQGALREGGRSSSLVARDRVRQLLVAAEVALSLMLLVGAGLLIRSGIILQRVEPGFDTARVFSAWLALPPAQYESVESVRTAYDRILQEIRAVPGVESAAGITVIPMTGLSAQGNFIPEGRAEDPANSISFNFRVATPGVFRTLRIPVKLGRDFDDRDVATSPCVIIVNEAGAKKAWPNENPIGKRIPGRRDAAGQRTMCSVVGVVGDAHDDGLREAVRPQIYFASAQAPEAFWFAMQRSMFVLARTMGDPRAMTKQLQAAVARVDPTLPMFDIRTMDERISASLATGKFNTMLLTTLGAIGLLLAAVGIYGVVAYFVTQRTGEIGLRMALGATPGRVLRLVVGQGMRPVVLGIVVGVGLAGAASRLLASLVFGVGTRDPLTFVAVPVMLGVIALAASVLPARRAIRVDPTKALQS